MSGRYAFQRSGGPLIYWTPGTVPRQSRAADARSLGGCGCNGGAGACACDGLGDLIEYRGGRPQNPAIAVPRGAARPYVMGLGAVSILPGAPEYLTDVPSDLIDPYETLENAAGVPKPSSSSFPVGKVVVGGLLLALAWPHLKKALK